MTTDSQTTLSTLLSRHICEFSFDKLPLETINAVRRLLLDYVGVAVAGSQTESGKIAREFAASIGGYEQATVIGGKGRVPAMQAAFANAISSHSVELDDIDVLALFHFSPPVYSAAIAAAQQQKR